MVTLELSDREAELMSDVLDDAILNADIEIDILTTHYPENAADLADAEYDLDTIYGMSRELDASMWLAEVGA